MSANGWEYVGKKNARGKAVNKKKLTADRLQHNIDDNNDGVIKASDTAFNAFLEFDKQKDEKPKPSSKASIEQIKDNVNPNKSKKKKNVSNVSPNDSPKSDKSLPKDFDSLAKQLKLSDFEAVTEETKIRFPDSPLIWIKDIGYYLNGKFPKEPDDVLFSDKPIDYPLSALPSNIREFLFKNIRLCPQPVLQLIQEQFLQSLVKNMLTNAPTMGFRIMLQCVSYENAGFTWKNIDKFVSHQISYQNRQSVCLSILWVAAQAGKSDLKVGLNVWLKVMFPLIGLRAYSKFVIDSLQQILELHSNSRLSDDVLKVDQFFELFDFIFLQNSLQPTVQKQLLFLYPKIKSVCYGLNAKNNLRHYFPNYFLRIKSHSSSEMTREILNELCYCLSVDNQCFSVWRSLYSHNLHQSSFLLKHLSENYQTLQSKLSIKLLKETVLSFRNTNDDARAQDRVLKDGHEVCEKYCEVLLNTMSSWKLPFKYLLLLLSFTFITFLVYDSKSNGSFYKSHTGKFLKETGTLPVLEHALNKIQIYYGHSYSWISINAPIYWKTLSLTIVPYINLFWEKFAEFSVYLWNSTEVVRVWFHKNIPPILETISDNYVPKIQSIAWQLWIQFKSHFVTVWSFILNIALISANWLQENIFTGSLSPENIQIVVINAIESLHKYVGQAYHWVSSQVIDLIK